MCSVYLMSKRKIIEDLECESNTEHYKRLVNENYLQYLKDISEFKHRGDAKPVHVSVYEYGRSSAGEDTATSNFNLSSSDDDSEFMHESDNVDTRSYLVESDTSDIESKVEVNHGSSLRKDLAVMFVQKQTPVSHVNGILKILNDHKDDSPRQKLVPKTRATLVKTPKQKITTRPLATGTEYYSGIRKALKNRQHLIKDLTELEIDIGIDGAKMDNSSKAQIWPTMGCITNKKNIRPFLIGCSHGRKKARLDDEFLQEFLNELKDVTTNGIDFVDKNEIVNKRVRVRLFVLDSPARADICNILNHSSYQGCPLCKFTDQVAKKNQKKTPKKKEEEKIEGKQQKRQKVTYSERVGIPRTDETYKARLHPEHHQPEYLEKMCALEEMHFKMVSQFPIDPMHCIDLGVVKKTLPLTILLLKRTDPLKVEAISERITAFKKFCPSDFARDCRTLEDVPQFKATECRQFLLYGCIVFLKDLVPDYIYEHWLLLHIAVRLLSSETLTNDNIDKAEILITTFLERYPSIYGADTVTYIIHVLLHIPFFSRLYGPLDSFSAYKFENFIQKLKKYIHKGGHSLQQICNRMEEEEAFCQDAYTIPNFNSTDIKYNEERDSFIALKSNNEIISVQVISIYEQAGVKYFGVRRCLNRKNFYTSPIASSELGEITYDRLNSEIEHFKAADFEYKYCRIPYEQIFVLIPILHTAFQKFEN